MAIIYDANRRIFYKQLSPVLECFARKLGKSDMSCCAACTGTAACRFLRQAGDDLSSNPLLDPAMDRAAKNGSAGERRAEGILFLPRDQAAVRISAVSPTKVGPWTQVVMRGLDPRIHRKSRGYEATITAKKDGPAGQARG
jgi:hypothetical protein